MSKLLPVEAIMRLGEILAQKNIWPKRNDTIRLCTTVSNHLEECVLTPEEAPDRMKTEAEYLKRLQDIIESTLFYGIQTKINSIYDGRIFNLLLKNLERLRDLLVEEHVTRTDREKLKCPKPS